MSDTAITTVTPETLLAPLGNIKAALRSNTYDASPAVSAMLKRMHSAGVEHKTQALRCFLDLPFF